MPEELENDSFYMMLGVSGLIGTSANGGAAAEAHESGGASGGSSEIGASTSIPGGGGMEETDRSGGGGGGGGNRWPRQETLALLKIRSEMDVTFRDSSLKGPLWEEISRKMAELGFQRSAKKCKEKFENVYKYHKRTKDCRASKSDGGKTYRFFDQIEALDNTPPPPPPQPPTTATTIASPPMPTNTTTVSSVNPNPTNSSQFQQFSIPPPPTLMNTSNPPQIHSSYQPSNPRIYSTTSTSSTSSDDDIQLRRGKKRKWRDFFRRITKDVIYKQEELLKKFLDTLERRDKDRLARDESWRVQEMARINREHEVLVQERSIAAARDTAVIAFLQKVTDQHNFNLPIGNNNAPPQAPLSMQVKSPENPPPPPPHTTLSICNSTVPPQAPLVIKPPENPRHPPPPQKISGSSSRWPKAEIETLIKIRTSLDPKYQDNGPKGPLWEEISIAMGKLGYNRSSKRCKEKWENINKYYKKVKESNKKRPEDSKTCPYFHQLDAIYKDKAKNDVVAGFNPMVPIMARPEQQWPILDDHQKDSHEMHDEDQDIKDHSEDDEDEEDEGGGYEMVANKQQQPSSVNDNTAE
ncbi:hypothetical protein BUALT_Bualt01G0017000 [Buddleja alternifolia]|uniref:Myb-like domain-containing protein n=1 Tax=Buddleja alternifolia TaxID=168488 RepID=A0AAV6Y532_9LAMI|nr:hypothetical protein BUALT_Bualt01G0017000 [Buddleja alternifolia]